MTSPLPTESFRDARIDVVLFRVGGGKTKLENGYRPSTRQVRDGSQGDERSEIGRNSAEI